MTPTDLDLALYAAASYPGANIPEVGRPDHRVMWGPDDAALFRRDGYAVIGVAGTHNAEGWVANLDRRMELTPRHGSVWAPAVVAAVNLWGRLARLVELSVHPTHGLYVVGHSRGGPIAHYMAAIADFEGRKPAGVLTLGAPRTGGKRFNERWAATGIPTTHLINESDPVPWVLSVLFGYHRSHTPRWFDGREWREGTSLCRWARTWLYSRRSFAELMAADHPIERYLAALGYNPT